MSDVIGKPERATQNRVVNLFKEELGYINLGNWEDRENNSNIEVDLLTTYLKKAGYKDEQVNRAIYQLQVEANKHDRSLYQNNKEVYSLLRYGVSVKIDASKPSETIKFINWAEPLKNDFAIAEEVTLKGPKERRPDLVLYVNGIAFGVLELKNSRVTIGDGIRQLISNQQPEFNDWFFTTSQILFAGNDSEGLRYGTILTPEKYYLAWKEDEEENDRLKLDKYLLKMCDKKRILEIMHDFVLFDGGVKKLPRVHQYFGIKAAQDHVQDRKGGIIWHTQGSGKSIVMVLLAKWILENKPNARIAIITDRDELDDQIERVFRDAGEKDIYRTSSGKDLVKQLGKATPRLLCSLVHKFGQRDVEDVNWDAFIKELKEQGGKAVGDFFVFVDECHRTQSGRLHEAMTAIMPNAAFIGFTGTPLLKKDKDTSVKVFGGYIGTPYKFSDAVEDKVVLDLLYEARDIDQKLTSEGKIDQWFDAKTKGLNSWQKDALKKKWATMQKLVTAKSRMEKVVTDIIFDFGTKPRLSNDRGNAILVASSILDACKYYNLFQKTEFGRRCGIITSYEPKTQNITTKNTGTNTKTDEEIIFDTYEEIIKNVQPEPGLTKAETYEKKTKALFIKEPANMKLLIVVSKLLTGFDAPSCTYLYIDKHMEDHGLFQAICRTNRLDGDDKDFGYIVDYKDLFKKVEKAIAVYSSELDHSAEGSDPAVMMKNRIDKAKERLDQAIESMVLVLEPIPAPKGELQSIHYFCGNSEIESDLKEKEPLRASLYKTTAEFARSYANLADDMDTAGYADTDIARIKGQLGLAVDLRDLIRRASGEELDLKAYEADMRHLIDNYIQADDPEKISNFDDISLLELIVKSGIADAIVQKMGKRKVGKESSAEIIENNVRRKIIQERLNDPAYFDQMSKLLDEVIKFRKEKAENYEKYLKKIEELAKKVQTGKSGSTPSSLKSNGQRALYNNLRNNEALALQIDNAVRSVRPADWRGNVPRENIIKKALWDILQNDSEVERIFQIIANQREY
ncbi:MAG: HsdR family type I site-specific deoxyribonuclease [Oligoflexia bacterium]|nr:HsdR family type I site-specific deoxyribonuclease [Oligoflexia bacterium]